MTPLAGAGAPLPGPNTRPAHPQTLPVPPAPPLSSWSSAWQPASPATYRGSGPHSGALALGGLRLLPVHGLGGPNFLSPHPEEEEIKEEGSAASPPGQLPLASVSPDSDGDRKHRLLPPPGAQPGNTLSMLIKLSRPHPPEAQFQPRARGGGGAALGVELRTERRSLGPQPLASRSPGAVCNLAISARASGPRLGQCPQGRWRQQRHPLRLSALQCHWPDPGVRSLRIGVELCGGGGVAAAAWSQEWATRREQRPQAPGASRPEKTSPLRAAAW